jgi:hypothetical protein
MSAMKVLGRPDMLDEVVLICPPGAEQGLMSHGGEPWFDHDLKAWLVCVPADVAADFCQVAGFYAPAGIQDRRPGPIANPARSFS